MKQIDAAELVRSCRRFIAIPSLSGEEEKMAQEVVTQMRALGFDEVRTDEFGSVIGRIRGTGGGATILLDGHIDTVPVENPSNWEHDPFGAQLEDGRIYGRGASDMKGALSAMIHAASRFVAERPSGDIYVTGTVHEEMFEGVALDHILKSIHPDYVIIGEASELNLKIGQRGRAEILITTRGKSCHSANPSRGINAVGLMRNVLDDLEGGSLPEDDYLGKGIMELTDIISHPYPGASVVPSSCSVTFDRRLVLGEEAPDMISGLQERLSQELRGETEVGISCGRATCYTGRQIEAQRFFPAWYFPPESPFVTASLEALHACGIPSRIQTYSFCTNGSSSAGVRGIPTLGFGPSQEQLAHVDDEYIEVEQLQEAAKGYAALIEALCR